MATPLQTVAATAVSAASITTPAFTNAVVVGNTLLAQCAAALNANGSTFTFSDLNVNTWTVDAAINEQQAGQNGAYSGSGRAPITTGGAGETVSCTLGSSTGYQLTAQEWKGTLTVDKTATATAAVSTTTITCTTATTTNAIDLFIGVYAGKTTTTGTAVITPANVNGNQGGVNQIRVVTGTVNCSCQMSYATVTAKAAQAMNWTYASDATGGYAATAVAYTLPLYPTDPPYTAYAQPAIFAQ